jgi:hypothetical protein
LLILNPMLNLRAYSQVFAATGRVQIPALLETGSAAALLEVLRDRTPWGLAWQVGRNGPNLLRASEAGPPGSEEWERCRRLALQGLKGSDYAFVYATYPLVTAYLEAWNKGSPQDRALEDINSPPFLDMLRIVTGRSDIVKADGQATLYAPGHFLALHDDREDARGRIAAYVLSMTPMEWRPEWGGYLNFFDDALDVVQSLRPRFNTLNLFRVPQQHNVGEVSAMAPLGRYAITGWARSK